MTGLSCRISVGRFASWLLWWACVSAWIDVGVSELKVKFGVLLPKHKVDRTKHPCPTLSLAKAEEWLIAEDLAPFNWIVNSSSSKAINAHFEYSNTQCSDFYGGVRAMEIFYPGAGCYTDDHGQSRNVKFLRVFYGPCCKYALSQVGKFTKYWNVPIISPGGLLSTFSTKFTNHYTTMTRFVALYYKMGDFLWTLLVKYGWYHMSHVWHENLPPDEMKGYHMCSDLMKDVQKLKRKYEKANEDNVTTSNSDRLQQGYKYNVNVLQHEKYVIEPIKFNEYRFDREDWNGIMSRVRNASRGE